MNIVPPNQELTVVQRWLQKLVEANKEREEQARRERERKPRKPYYPKPKPQPKKKKEAVAMAPVERSRRKYEDDSWRNYESRKGQGYVYLMRSGNGYHKIGITKNIKQRVTGIRIEFPVEIDVLHYIASNNHRKVEMFLHNKYSSKRLQHEWFNLDQEDIRWIMSLQDYELDDKA